MYRIKESKVKIKFKDNRVKKSGHNVYCSDNDCETIFQSLYIIKTRT